MKRNSQVENSSALLASRCPETRKRLTDILRMHNVAYAFHEGTKEDVNEVKVIKPVFSRKMRELMTKFKNCCKCD
ncbi:MAG: hypothetical protein ACI30S_01795 [Muribaculaceae bacterium]